MPASAPVQASETAPPLLPAVFIERAQAEGLRLVRDSENGDALRVIGPPAVRKKPAIVAYIKRYKSEIVALLPPSAPLSQSKEGDAAPPVHLSPNIAAPRLTPEQEAALQTLAAAIDAEPEPSEATTEPPPPDWRPLLDAARAGVLPMVRVELGQGVSTSNPGACALACVGALRAAVAAVACPDAWFGWQGLAEAEERRLDLLAAWFAALPVSQADQPGAGSFSAK